MKNMAAEKLIFLVVLSAILYEAVKADECVHDGDCHALGNRSRAVCCKNNFLGSKCRKSCVGLMCSEDYNCGGAYCCQYECRESCLNVSCISDRDCGGFKCCNYKCRKSCLGQSCLINEDCSDVKYCCNGRCSERCTGQSCMINSECGGDNGYCCNYSCQKGNCGLSDSITVLIVLLVLGWMATVAVLALYYYCSHRRRSPGFIGADQLAISDTTPLVDRENGLSVQDPIYPAPVQSED